LLSGGNTTTVAPIGCAVKNDTFDFVNVIVKLGDQLIVALKYSVVGKRILPEAPIGAAPMGAKPSIDEPLL